KTQHSRNPFCLTYLLSCPRVARTRCHHESVRASRPLAAVTVLFAVLAGCGHDATGEPGSRAQKLRVEVVATHPHDPSAFTQGLEIDDGELLEGTGRVGHSLVSARAVNVTTTPVSISATERTRSPVVDEMFGEGITVVDDTVWQ